MLGLAIIYLVSMVVSVPIFTKIGLGALPGYLLIGVFLGSGGANILGALGHSPTEVLELSEFGIVFMLFLIGLEIDPKSFKQKGKDLLGLGSAQVVFSVIVIAVVLFALFRQQFTASTLLILALVLAFSSTAIAIPALDALGYSSSQVKGRTFLVLLFQDLLVIPFLSLLPLLSPQTAKTLAADSETGWLKFGKVLLASGCVLGLSFIILKKVFRLVAQLKLHELFTALALMIVLASAAIMHTAGVSLSFGAFLAGTMLSTSEYRYQLETDLAPFKGLLMGAFFISLGASLDLTAVALNFPLFITVFLSLTVLKGLAVGVVSRLFKMPRADRGVFAISLAQGSEFALVLFFEMRSHEFFGPEIASVLSGAVIASMFVTPIALKIYKMFIEPRFFQQVTTQKGEEPQNLRAKVLVAGLGRFGQGVVRLLRANGIKPTVLDFDGDQIEILKGFGLEAFYGDVSRMDLLEAAGAGDATILVLAIDSFATTTEIIPKIRQAFPHLKIYARAYDRVHAYELMGLKVDHVLIETSGSAFEMGRRVLVGLGAYPRAAYQAKVLFEKRNEASIHRLAKHYHESDEETFFTMSKQASMELENMLKDDLSEGRQDHIDRGWTSAPSSSRT